MLLGEFLDWIDSAPPLRRSEAARSIARSYLDKDVDPEAKGAIEAALTVLLDDNDAGVRFAIADVLGASAAAPRHVIFTLAGDRTDIAALVLARSPVFIDAELADIAAAAEGALQLAVARRPAISTAVSAAIAEAGEQAACIALLGNPGAEIARISFQRIAERFSDHAEVRTAMLARDDLPPHVRQRLVRAVSDALVGLPMVKAWVPEGRVVAFARDACDRATVAIAAETETRDLAALVEHLRVTGQLTTALLLRAVCAGNIAFFETALATLARVPASRIAKLVRAGRTGALRAAYGKAGLPAVAFAAFAAALDTWRRFADENGPEDRYRFTLHVVDAVLARYADITDGEANDLAAMLRRFAADQAREAARDHARDGSAYLGAVTAQASSVAPKPETATPETGPDREPEVPAEVPILPMGIYLPGETRPKAGNDANSLIPSAAPGADEPTVSAIEKAATELRVIVAEAAEEAAWAEREARRVDEAATAELARKTAKAA
jgi:uncharacterized protein (DUF2336 family)